MGKKKIKNVFYIKKKKENRKSGRKRVQKGGAFGAGMALGMFLPQILGTVGNILKINVKKKKKKKWVILTNRKLLKNMKFYFHNL